LAGAHRLYRVAFVDARAQRAAQNESLFRRINERVEALSSDFDALTLVCECADAACVERLVGVSREEYEAVRAHSDRFLVKRGHERGEFETVVGERRDYLIVEKHGEAGDVAIDEDPRSG
jgi:hypothetical protein